MVETSQYYKEAFSRNIGIFTEEQQTIIQNSTVAIAGLGGVGGIYATTFARLGFGNFKISDLDIFEEINMNRQQLANVTVLGREKAVVAEEAIHAINPDANVKVFPEGINEKNIDDFLSGADIVLDGIDFFTFDARRMLYNKAREKGIFLISAAPVGYGSSLLVFDPKGMSFDDYFDIQENLTAIEKLIRFGLGVTPTLLQRSYFDPKSISWKNHKAPSLVTGTLLCANLASTYAVKILFGEKVRVIPKSLHFDPYLSKYVRVWIPFGNKNPLQVIKRRIMTSILRKRENF